MLLTFRTTRLWLPVLAALALALVVHATRPAGAEAVPGDGAPLHAPCTCPDLASFSG